MRIIALTTFNPTIPTWDCVSRRVHKISQKIPRKDLKKEMREEFELINVTISLARQGKTKTTVKLQQANQFSVQSCKACHVTEFVPAHLGRREEILPCCVLKHLWNKNNLGLFHFKLVKEKNNFSTCFHENVNNETLTFLYFVKQLILLYSTSGAEHFSSWYFITSLAAALQNY